MLDAIRDFLNSYLRGSWTSLIDIGLVAIVIYWLFILIRGTRAVRIVIGLSILYLVYLVAQALDLRLLSTLLQTGAVVGLFAIVVVFQPELRRALEQIGRMGSVNRFFVSSEVAGAERTAREISRAARLLAGSRHGALIVLERETGLADLAAESGVPLHADLRAELLATIFYHGTALHDGAVIVSAGEILAAGVLLPLSQERARLRALRDAAPCGDRDQRAVRCDRGGRQRGDRFDLARDARPDRAQPDRGAAATPPLQPAPSTGAAPRRSVPAPDAGGSLAVACQRGGAAADRPGGAGRAHPASRDRAAARIARAPPLMRFLFRNWHLKLGAVALATVLYTGLVFSGSFTTDAIEVPITTTGQPAGNWFLLNTTQLGSVELRYRVATDSAREITPDSFVASVDLSRYDLEQPGTPQSLRIEARSVIDGVTVLDQSRGEVTVALDQVTAKNIPVRLDRGRASRPRNR